MIGLSIAWELSRRQKRVCVVDRQGLGKATSWAGAGILPPPLIGAKHDPLEQLRSYSHSLHIDWQDRLRRETGIDNGLRSCGGIYFARTAGEAASLRVTMLQATEEGVQVEPIPNGDLVARFPALNSIASSVAAAFYLPDEMQIRSPRHLQALVTACAQQGVELCPDADVDSVIVQGSDAIGVRSKSTSIEARETILCGGPWTADLLQPFEFVLPVEPWRGQLILCKTEAPIISHVVNEGYRYAVPREDGHLVVGATVEDVGFDGSTTEEAIADLRAYSIDLFPQLQHQDVIKSWAGLRPKTPDGNPFLGRVPGYHGLSVAAGHYRSGLHLAPATAVFMADLLLQDTTFIDKHPFRLNR